MKKSDIFKIFAIAGVGVTAYLTAKAVPYFEDYYEEWVASRNFADDDDEKIDAHITFIKNTIKAFGPAVFAGASTILSIIMLDKSHEGKELALMAQLYSAKKVIETAKKNPKLKLNYTFNKQEVDKIKIKKDEILVYEPYTDQIFPTTMRLIEKAEEKGNKRLNNYYFQTLNRFLKDIGGKPCAFGDILGWSCEKASQMRQWQDDGPYFKVNLTSQDADGQDIYIIEYTVDPLKLYEVS